jgi:hypothetical protein
VTFFDSENFRQEYLKETLAKQTLQKFVMSKANTHSPLDKY